MSNRSAYMHLSLLGFVCLSLICWNDGAHAAGHNRSGRVDRMIVKYKESDQKTAAHRQRASLRHSKGELRQARRRTGGNAEIYYLDRPHSTADARGIARELMQRPEVEYAEPDYRRYPAFVPNDTRYLEQWYLKRSTLEPGAINAEQAWDLTRGDADIVIAVIDTGILQHEDIARVLPGHDFISADDLLGMDFFTANDGDGRDPDPADPGDAVTAGECGDDEPEKDEFSSWHGTLVGGVLIAETHSLIPQGIAGLDHAASILPLRALGKCGGFASDIADAIRWAAGLPVDDPVMPNPTPADVINLSLGGPGGCSVTEQDAINAAVAAGVVVVAAAGNEATIGINSPANCDKVIAVAATTRQGAETCYTNIDSNVDLSAPGGNDSAEGCSENDFLISTGNNGTTVPDGDDIYQDNLMGTSFATPLVSGAAALMKAIDSSLTPTSIETILKNTARAFPDPDDTNDSPFDCEPGECGTGILDVFGAVTAAGQGGLDSVPNPFSFEDRDDVSRGTLIVSNSVAITGIDTNSAVSISGNGEYSIDGASFTGVDGTINANQSIRIRLRSSSAHNTSLTTTLSVGGVSDTFSVTTQRRSGGGGGAAAWLLPLLIAWRLPRRHVKPAKI